MKTMQAHRHPYLPPEEPPAESRFATWLIGGAALFAWGYFFLVLLPGLAAK